MTTVESFKRRLFQFWDRLTLSPTWQRSIRNSRRSKNRPGTWEFKIDLGEDGCPEQCYYNSCLTLSTSASVTKPATPRPLRKRLSERPAASCHELGNLRSYRETHFPSADADATAIITWVDLGNDSVDSTAENSGHCRRTKSVQTISSDSEDASTGGMLELCMRECLESIYPNYLVHQRWLERQARDVLLCRFGGDWLRMRQEFLEPAAQLIGRLHCICHQSRFHVGTGWPFTFDDRIVLHLNSPSFYELTAGDVYLAVDGALILVVVRDESRLCRLRLKDLQDLKEPRLLNDLLRAERLQVDRLIVASADGSVQRMPWMRLVSLPSQDVVSGSAFCTSCQSLDQLKVNQSPGEEDAMTQTCTMDMLAASLPHIDSDVSDDDCSRSLIFSHQSATLSPKPPTASVHLERSKPAEGRMSNMVDPTDETMQQPPPQQQQTHWSIDQFSDTVLKCGVYMAGVRHRGRAVVVVELALLSNQLTAIAVPQLADLLGYYHSVPRKAATKNGMVLLVIGDTSRFEDAFRFLEQALRHYHQDHRKCVDNVVLWNPSGQLCTEVRPLASGHSMDSANNAERLADLMPVALSLECCGGALVHHQQEWIAFRKIVEPFVNSCRVQGKRLYQAIHSLKKMTVLDAAPAGASTDSDAVADWTAHIKRLIQQAQTLFDQCVDDTDLLALQSQGPRHLQDIAAAKSRLGDNTDARETLERCSAMYVQVQRTVNRLNRVWESRRLHLEKQLKPRDAASRSRQILSWLCRKGEETLARYNSTPAESLASAKMQQREFQRFLALAHKQIDKGKELLDDLQRESTTQTGSILDLASSLENQLSKFGHRLEDTRERLEDTTKCYELLDKAYEWGVEAMKLASKLKLDQQQPCPAVSAHLLQQVDEFLAGRFQGVDQSALDDLNSLARKLDNAKLVDQCKLAQNRCQETLELLQFRRSMLLEWIREQEENQPKPAADKSYAAAEVKVYENIEELTAAAPPAPAPGPGPAAEDKVDGCVKRFELWKPNDSGSDSGKSTGRESDVVLLRVKADGGDKKTPTVGEPVAYQLSTVRGAPAYSSATSLSSYGSSSSWSSRMKNAIHRKISSGEDSINEADDPDARKDNRDGGESATSGGSPKEEAEETTSVCQSPTGCQSPLSVNSHLVCRASSIDLSLPIAEMQEAGLTEDVIKSQKTLLLIMHEMIQTERDYVRSLEYIIEHYIPELSREDIPQALRGKRNVIFGNIEKIYGFHHHYFLRELERCQHSPFLVGQCFLRHEQHFYLYALYNKNKPKSDALMAEYGTAFFRRKQTELGDKMDLASYLLKPVQRMGKYALLLKQLLKESGDKEPEFADLMAAEQMVRFQLRHGNDLLAMDSLRDCDVNVKEQGRLLRQSEFYCWQGRKKGLRHVFLFEDLILFSKSKRDPERKNLDIYIYKQSMKTSDIGFTAQVGDSKTRFEIWFRKRKPNETIVLEATNTDVKEAWVDDISRLLWKQALRNRELRMAEMAEMGIGNKPCLEIRPSQNQISDRSISYAQLAKAPKYRHSVCGSIISDSRSSKRPHSIISVSSSASSASSGSGSVNGNRNSNTCGIGQDQSPSNPLVNLHRTKTNQSQCSAESGILADLSMSYDDPDSSAHCRVGRSDSSVTTLSAESVSPSSPVAPKLQSSPYPNSLNASLSVYVNNTLIPITPLSSHKNLPMTEM